MKLSRDEDRVNNPIQVEPSVWAWPPELNKIADVVLAYKPKPKTKAAKRRKRRVLYARRKKR